MTKKNYVPVRLDDEQINRIDRLVEIIPWLNSRADVLRLLIDGFDEDDVIRYVKGQVGNNQGVAPALTIG